MNHFDDPERLSTLASYELMDTPPDPLLDKIVQMAAETMQTPGAMISCVDETRHWCKARVGLERGELQLRESLCRLTIARGEILIIPDARIDPRCADNPVVQCEDGIRFYAGIPIFAHNGHPIASLCVFDHRRRRPAGRQIERLKNLAHLATGVIEAHRAGIVFRDEKEYLLRLADNSPGGLFEFAVNAKGQQWLNFVSAGIRDTIGISPEEALHDIANVFGRIHPDDAEGFFASIAEAVEKRSPWEHEFRVAHPERGEVHVLGMSSPTRAKSGVMTWQGCLMDITEKAQEREHLRRTQRELEKRYTELSAYQKILEQIGRMARVGACSFDMASGEINWTNEVYAIHGVGRDFQPTMPAMLAFCDPAHREEVRWHFHQTLRTGEPLEIEYPIDAADGTRRWLKAIVEADGTEGAGNRLIGSLQDVTEERRLLERVSYHATHDHVTGLANRPTFLAHLSELLRASETGVHAVGFLDLDHFKDVNDAFGYDAGDQLITEIGRRLDAVARRYGGRSAAARFGGDEFAFVLADLKTLQGLPRRLRAVFENLAAPADVGGHSIRAAVSMGVSIAPRDGRVAAALLRKADLALRHSKQSGRARISFFTRTMEAAVSEEQRLKSEMAQGIAAGAFEVFYQPVMDITLGRLDGFEALLRWHHPTRGLLSAGVFAHLLDEANIGSALSAIVIEQVRDTILAWTAAGIPFGQIAINITSSQLRNPVFEEQLRALVAAGVRPAHLKLEITEGVLLGRTADRAFQILSRLREQGFTIALDDFGTGYASLVHLTEFPIDQIKIDMSFVRQITESDKARTIVHTMCALANGLNLTAVAEGIEDANVEQMLRLMGCHFGQGYLYDKALPRDQAMAFILDRLGPEPLRRKA